MLVLFGLTEALSVASVPATGAADSFVTVGSVVKNQLLDRLRRGQAARAGREPDVGGARPDGRGQVLGIGLGEPGAGGKVGDRERQCLRRPVVRDRRRYQVATVEIHTAGRQVVGGHGGAGAVGVNARRVVALAIAVVQVELDGQAVREGGGAFGVAERAPPSPPTAVGLVFWMVNVNPSAVLVPAPIWKSNVVVNWLTFTGVL